MTLKTAEAYVESLRDGRVTFWDGERIDDITQSPKFAVPIAVAARDYDLADPARAEVMTYVTETGERAHRVFQIPRGEDDLVKRVRMMEQMSIVGGVTGVMMALMSAKDDIALVNERYADNIERLYRHVRDNDCAPPR